MTWGAQGRGTQAAVLFCRGLHFCPMGARSLEWVSIQDNLREWFPVWFLCNFPNKIKVEFVSQHKVFHVSTHSLLWLPRGCQMGKQSPAAASERESEPSYSIGHALSAVCFESPLMQARGWALVTPDTMKAQKKGRKYLSMHSYNLCARYGAEHSNILRPPYGALSSSFYK